MYTDTVTVFNLKDDIWYPTVITNVDLIVDQAASIVKTGLDSADAANLHVKYTPSGSNALIGDKTYLPPKEWLAQSDTTLDSGADGGIFDSAYASVDNIDGGTFSPWSEGDTLEGGSFTLSMTFNEGVDFFILGDWGSEDALSDDEYGVNGFYHYCNKKYDHCYSIKTVAKYKLIPHFEIGGK
ncbi:MAG: hypothetical protein ACRDBM_17290 [Sporomusa sp.]